MRVRSWALAGARGEKAAGNGAAMRIAPLAFVLNAHEPSHRRMIRDVCWITHHSDEAYIGSLAVLAAIQWRTWPPEPQFFENLAGLLPDSRVRDRLSEYSEISRDTPLSLVAKRFGCSGYVVETVPLAIFGAICMAVHGFEAALDEIAHTGGDVDTIGSLAGQVAGSHLGRSRLPEHLVGLASVEEILPAADAFARFVGVLLHDHP